jgi:alanine dehydrogenase
VTLAGTLLFTRSDVAALLDLSECIEAVEDAFRLLGEGKIEPAGILGFPEADGGFHVKAGVLPRGARRYFAAKINGNFPDNPRRHGLPAIQGAVLLCDAGNGYPLAIFDSIEITIRRTGAATAVAAKHLAREDARVATIFGCGNQGRVQLESLCRVRKIERAWACDTDPEAAKSFAERMSRKLRIPVEAASEPRAAARSSDIIVTCTPSKKAFLSKDDISAGAFVAAVGADSPDKQELEPALLAAARVVVDSLEQCARIGELHHALEAGVLSRSAVHAELSELAAARKPGRLSADEITVFDSTGTAIQDAAAAALVFEKALRQSWQRVLPLAD